MSNSGHGIKDPDRAEQEHKRIEWGLQEIPVLRELTERFANERPLQGIRMSGYLHILTETANLAHTLKSAERFTGRLNAP